MKLLKLIRQRMSTYIYDVEPEVMYADMLTVLNPKEWKSMPEISAELNHAWKKRRQKDNSGNIATAMREQIYGTLEKLAEPGFIETRRFPHKRNPRRAFHRLTQKGLEHRATLPGQDAKSMRERGFNPKPF